LEMNTKLFVFTFFLTILSTIAHSCEKFKYSVLGNLLKGLRLHIDILHTLQYPPFPPHHIATQNGFDARCSEESGFFEFETGM
jgi:hypothetical protein